MRRRPLLRAAAIGGGAYVAGQRRRLAQRARQGKSAQSAAARADQIAQLKQLGELHANGVLADAEFAAQKAKVLGA